MLGLFRSAFSSGIGASRAAGPSRAKIAHPLPAGTQVRFRGGQLAPKRFRYKKSMKGRPALPTVRTDATASVSFCDLS